MMQVFDIIIIGAGPTGLNCAIAAKRAGLHYLVLEKGTLVNAIYHFPTNMTFFSTSNLLEIGEVPFIAHGDKPTRREALEYYRRVWAFFGLELRLYEEVTGVHRQENDLYVINSTKTTYSARRVIVCTGYYDTPRRLNVPGEDLPKVKHYYDDPHLYAGQQILVVGAANSACDVALETYYKGAVVTMAIRESEIYPGVKYWIRPNIENRIKEGSIKAFFNTEVVSIASDHVVLKGPEGQITLPNDFVLAMTGYQPNYAFLEKLGIRVTPGETQTPEYNPDTFESNLPGVYLAGVLCAGLQTNKLFIENTRHHGEQIIKHILASKNSIATQHEQ